MSIKTEALLEAIAEAIRTRRRWGPYPCIFELGSITWDTENRRIELDILDNGEIVKYDLLLDRVSEHGETSIIDEEINELSTAKSD